MGTQPRTNAIIIEEVALPRLMSGLVAAVVLGAALGPAWGVGWYVPYVATSLALISAARAERRKGVPTLQLLIAGLTLGVVSVSLSLALWSGGEGSQKAFALVWLVIGATMVLHSNYDQPKRLLQHLAPHLIGVALLASDMGGLLANWSWPHGLAAIGAIFMMTFFLVASAGVLRGARTKLLAAQAQAEAGERAAEQASAAKSAFLANMSHEIRTPLNGVLGMVQAIAAGKLSRVQRERLGVVRQSGETLLTILNDILDLAKIEAGKLDLEEVEFDLQRTAIGAYSPFTAIAEAKGVALVVDLEAAQGHYRGDPTRLRQILSNFVSNALKFTASGEIRVTGTYSVGVLELSVEDTGIGIAPEGLERLFQKFDQLGASTGRRYGGTGLGLSICQHLAGLMNGEIVVESELGRGSRFLVRLPLPRVGDAVEAATAPAPTEAQAAPSRPLRVLAADDNAVNQLVLRTLLQQFGIDAAVVEDGEAAVAAWESEDWDLILMDVQMPRMDGLEATGVIREKERAAGAPRTPILALTADAMAHQIASYREAGLDGFVAKPIEAGDLIAEICRLTAGGEATPTDVVADASEAA
jgi:two-component system, sensor histidine kinase